jgi:hypothetical protein
MACAAGAVKPNVCVVIIIVSFQYSMPVCTTYMHMWKENKEDNNYMCVACSTFFLYRLQITDSLVEMSVHVVYCRIYNTATVEIRPDTIPRLCIQPVAQTSGNRMWLLGI